MKSMKTKFDDFRSDVSTCIFCSMHSAMRNLLSKQLKSLASFTIAGMFGELLNQLILSAICSAYPADGSMMYSFPEMEVKEIILTKVSRLCQMSSHSCGFFSRL
jgi:hypothetical protein